MAGENSEYLIFKLLRTCVVMASATLERAWYDKIDISVKRKLCRYVTASVQTNPMGGKSQLNVGILTQRNNNIRLRRGCVATSSPTHTPELKYLACVEAHIHEARTEGEPVLPEMGSTLCSHPSMDLGATLSLYTLSHLTVKRSKKSLTCNDWEGTQEWYTSNHWCSLHMVPCKAMGVL